MPSFQENRILTKWLLFTDIGKSRPCREFIFCHKYSCKAIRRIKILAKIEEFIVYWHGHLFKALTLTKVSRPCSSINSLSLWQI